MDQSVGSCVSHLSFMCILCLRCALLHGILCVLRYEDVVQYVSVTNYCLHKSKKWLCLYYNYVAIQCVAHTSVHSNVNNLLTNCVGSGDPTSSAMCVGHTVHVVSCVQSNSLLCAAKWAVDVVWYQYFRVNTAICHSMLQRLNKADWPVTSCFCLLHSLQLQNFHYQNFSRNTRQCFLRS